MTDEIDILEKTITQYKEAKRIKNMNLELLEYLSGSIYYLLKYSEKYAIKLPKKLELIRLLDKSKSMLDEISHQPIVNTNNNSREDNSTHKIKSYILRYFNVR